jgi:hypothetical protein
MATAMVVITAYAISGQIGMRRRRMVTKPAIANGHSA